MPGKVLFDLRIGTNGGLVDSSGVLHFPANSHANFSSNYVFFKWKTRRARWNKDTFIVDGKANKTITDLFEAAISKANRSIKPYDIKFDKRMKLVSFRQWLYVYTRGKSDYRNDTWKIAQSFSRQKLRDAGARMSMSRVLLASIVYPFVLNDQQTFVNRFQRSKDPKAFIGTCYRLAYAPIENSYQLPRITNFISWNINKRTHGWAQYLTVHPYAPALPKGVSQQIIRSFPVYTGKYDQRARSLAEGFSPDTLYGVLMVISVRSMYFVYRDLSYPAKTFPYLGRQEIEFTDEDREWNVPEVFDHRTWDPYEVNNWLNTKLVSDIRNKNRKHVRSKIAELLDNDPTFLEHSINQLPSSYIRATPEKLST